MSTSTSYDVMDGDDVIDTFRTQREAEGFVVEMEGCGCTDLRIVPILVDEHGKTTRS